MKSKIWIAGWFSIVTFMLCVIGGWVYRVDPFFHYHKPDIEEYFYRLNNERSQNDGITKHFDYDALITGTSMTENFQTSEMDEIFGCNSIKVPFSGGSYKEINDNLRVALKNNENLKIIIRCLDMGRFFDEKDAMRNDLGTYPTYLYDRNPFNDVNYLFNRDIIWNRVYAMTESREAEDFAPGITSFDDYARWQKDFTFGRKTVLPNGIAKFEPGAPVHLTNEEKEIIRGNIEQNVTMLAKEYPDVKFYYFFSPYSIVWWQPLVSDGTVYKQLEAEQYIIELILEAENIQLFSFNNRYDITADLNNYKDTTHYGTWVNSLILQWMHDKKYQLTKENYLDYLRNESEFYLSFDYTTLNEQEDYENDYYVDALYNEELLGSVPVSVLDESTISVNLNKATLEENQHNGKSGIKCVGTLERSPNGEYSVEDSFKADNYVGANIRISNAAGHRYLVFYGKKTAGHGQPTVMVFNEQKEKVGEVNAHYGDIDDKWRQYLIRIPNEKGIYEVVFNGGYVDNTGDTNSCYIFSDIYLY